MFIAEADEGRNVNCGVVAIVFTFGAIICAMCVVMGQYSIIGYRCRRVLPFIFYRVLLHYSRLLMEREKVLFASVCCLQAPGPRLVDDDPAAHHHERTCRC